MCETTSVVYITVNMSGSEPVNVDVDSVGHDVEPTTVEVRERVSNVEILSSTQENIPKVCKYLLTNHF